MMLSSWFFLIIAYFSWEITAKSKICKEILPIPHPDDCSKFLVCAPYGQQEMNCAPGTLFNSKLHVCDWPWNVNCDRSTTRIGILTTFSSENITVNETENGKITENDQENNQTDFTLTTEILAIETETTVIETSSKGAETPTMETEITNFVTITEISSKQTQATNSDTSTEIFSSIADIPATETPNSETITEISSKETETNSIEIEISTEPSRYATTTEIGSTEIEMPTEDANIETTTEGASKKTGIDIEGTEISSVGTDASNSETKTQIVSQTTESLKTETDQTTNFETTTEEETVSPNVDITTEISSKETEITPEITEVSNLEITTQITEISKDFSSTVTTTETTYQQTKVVSTTVREQSASTPIGSTSISTSTTQSQTCDKTTVFPHPKDCKKYILCTDEGTEIVNCPPGLSFHPTFLVCIHDTNVNCSEDLPALRSALTLKNIETSHETDIILAKTEQEQTVFKVNNYSKSYEESSEENNEDLNEYCDNVRGIFVMPHPKNVQKYILCSFGIGKPMNCRKRLFKSNISACN